MRFSTDGYNRAEIFKILREWSGLTQEQLAKKLDKSIDTIRGYEQNKTPYSIDTLLKIAEDFDIKITFEK